MKFNKKKLISLLDRVIEYSLYAIAVILPFSKAILETAVVALIFTWFARRIVSREKWNLPAPLVVLAFTFFALTALSLLNSAYLPQSLKALFSKTGKYILLMFAVATGARDRKVLFNTAQLFLLSALIVALDGFAQFFLGFDLIQFNFCDVIYRGWYWATPRISACLPAPTVLASYLLAALMLAVGFLFTGKKIPLKKFLFNAVFTLFMLLCFMLTFSRGAYIALFICVLWLAFYKTKKILLLFLPVVVILAFFPHRSYLSRSFFTKTVDPTAQERFLLWQGTVDMIKTHPFIGHGLNTYNANYPKYKSPKIMGNPYAHNSYLQMLAEIGIVGFASFIILMAYIYGRGLFYLTKMPRGELESLSSGAMAGITGLFIHAFFDNVFFAMVPAMAFWFMLGYNLAIERLALGEARNDEQSPH